MIQSSATLAVAASIALASSAGAAVVTYQFNGSLTSNTMASGAFVGASAGVPVSLQITVDTATAPIYSTANRNHWDTVAGTILGMKATVNGITSVATPNSAPTHARVVDDALNGSVYVDQFWFEVGTLGASPDFKIGAVSLSSVGAAPPISSSLSGTNWPTTNAEVDPYSFTLERYLYLRGATGPEFLRADITSVIVAPAPGALVPMAIAACAVTRRRRR